MSDNLKIIQNKAPVALNLAIGGKLIELFKFNMSLTTDTDPDYAINDFLYHRPIQEAIMQAYIMANVTAENDAKAGCRAMGAEPNCEDLHVIDVHLPVHGILEPFTLIINKNIDDFTQKEYFTFILFKGNKLPDLLAVECRHMRLNVALPASVDTNLELIYVHTPDERIRNKDYFGSAMLASMSRMIQTNLLICESPDNFVVNDLGIAESLEAEMNFRDGVLTFSMLRNEESMDEVASRLNITHFEPFGEDPDRLFGPGADTDAE